MEGRRDGPAKRVGPLDSVKVALWSFPGLPHSPERCITKQDFHLTLT
jgi:hypothetical protein